VDGATVLASHPRSYDRDAQIELPGHVEALVGQKSAARQHRATDRLVQAAPASQTLLIRAAERGANQGFVCYLKIEEVGTYAGALSFEKLLC
jgi:hypothetical protein